MAFELHAVRKPFQNRLMFQQRESMLKALSIEGSAFEHLFKIVNNVEQMFWRRVWCLDFLTLDAPNSQYNLKCSNTPSHYVNGRWGSLFAI